MAASAADRELTRMTRNIEAMEQEVKAEFEARTDVPATMRASQSRMISAVIYLPIATMARQLKQ